MKLFQINDYDYYVAPDLESAIGEAIRLTGLDRDEAVDDPSEVSDEALD